MSEQDESETPVPGSDSENPSEDASQWARPVQKLKVTAPVPEEGMNLNVEGRQVNSPLQGFGQLWRKKYRVRIQPDQARPKEVIQTWKDHFPEFWPKGNRFFAPLSGIKPGEVAVLNLAVVPGVDVPVLSTGVMVIYADEQSFTFMTPEGHMFCGFITFSSFEDKEDTVAQIDLMVRATDPIYELGMRVNVIGTQEDIFWQKTLTALAERFGSKAPVETDIVILDPKVQWSQAGNVWKNAAIRSAVYMLGSPFRWAARRLRGKQKGI